MTPHLWASCVPVSVSVTNNSGGTAAGSLGDAINQINASPCGGTIDLSAISGQTVSMTGAYAYVTQSVTILGANVTLNGQGLYQGLNLGGGVSSVSGMSVSIANLSIVDAKAQGGAGGDSLYGGGGGLGAGGGIFVNTGVTLSVDHVTFNGDSAIGGNGGGYTTTYSNGGGGGGGIIGNGTSVIIYGGNGGGPNGGTAGYFADGQDGGWGGGGGGLGTGGGHYAGDGGFGGGGGGSWESYQSSGGFGGGSGGGGFANGSAGPYGGAGGYGGGLFGAYQYGGGGGGGAGLGGGIFLYQGASLNIVQGDFSSGAVQGGNGGGNPNSYNGQAGQGLGQDLFIYGSTVTFGGGNSSLSGSIAGTGGVMVNNSSTVTLSGNNTYSGGTTIDSGWVVAGNNNAFGTGDLSLLNNGTLRSGVNGLAVTNNLDLIGNGIFDSNGNDSMLSGVISGTGSLAVTDRLGGGALTLTNANTYSGGTDLQKGLLNLQNNNALGTGAVTLENNTVLQSGLQLGVNDLAVTNNLTLNGTGIFDINSNNSTLSGVIGGSGNLAVTNSGSGGTLFLTGNNSYTGGTYVDNGLLNINNDNNLGTGSVTLNGSTLQTAAGISSSRGLQLASNGGVFDSEGNASLWSGTIGGSGSLSVSDSVGGGSLTLTGTNGYSGGTSLNGGTLIVGSSSALGSGNLTYNGGTLQTSASITLGVAVSLVGNGTFDSNGFNSILSGVVNGTGDFTKTGTGALTLTAADTYTGLTDIDNGSLVLGTGGSLTATAAVTIGSNGTLDLNGHNQTLSELSGSGNVSLGAGKLTVGDSTDQALSGVISGSGSLIKVGSGALTLSGDNSYTGATTVTGGTLALSGTNSYTGGTWVGAGTLNVASDGSMGSGNLVLDGGTLQTAAGVTSSKGISLIGNNGILDSNGYDSVLSGVISGAGSLTKVGSGVVTLGATNTYTGGTTVSGGALNISSLGNLGSGALVLDGGYLQTGAALTVTQGVSLTSNGGGIDTNGFDSLVSGVLSGTGGLNKAGAGALTLTGTNTYSGGTNIGGGTLNVSQDANLGTGNLSLSNGTLQASGSFTTTKNLNLGGAVTLDTQGNNLEIDGVLSGGGVFLTKMGSGSLTLTGTNNFSGFVTLAGGDLDVASNANLGNINRLIFNGGTLQATDDFSTAKSLQLVGNGTFDTNGNDCSLASTISGPGTLTVTGGGSLTMLGSLSNVGRTNYTGLVSVQNADLVTGFSTQVLFQASVSLGSTGELELANNNETIKELTGSGLLLLDGGNLTVGDGNDQVFSGSVSGGHALIKQGSGTLTLTGNSSYSGGTQVNGGTLNISNSNNLGTGGLTLNTATLQAGADFTSSLSVALGGSANIDTQNFNATFSGQVSGAGSLNKLGTGTLTLNGADTYTGGTNVSAGTFQVGDSVSPAAYMSGPVSVASGALLTGYGAILGTVINDGSIQAGGTSGTLSIAQLDETSGGTLQVQVGAGNGQSGLLYVLNAQLDGAVSVYSTGGTYGIRSKYLILTSGAPLVGTFSSVLDNVSYMTPTLQYGTNSVTLVMTRNNVDFSALSQTPNGIAVGTVLNQTLATASDDFVDHLNNLYGLPAGQDQALRAMDGSSYTPLAASALNNSFYSSNLLFARMSGMGFKNAGMAQALASDAVVNPLMAEANGLATGSPSSAAFHGFWLQNNDSFGSIGGNDDVIGYSTKSYGFVGGYDTSIADSFKGGVAFSYGHSTLTSADAGSSNTQVESYLASLYGTRGFGDWDLSAVAGFGWDQYATTRTITFGTDVNQAQGNFAGNEVSAALQGTYHLKVSGVSVNPMVGLQYSGLWQYGFTETGAGSLDLTVAGQTYSSLKPVLGVTAIKAFPLGGAAQLVPAISLNASRELMDVTPKEQAAFAGAPGSSFTVTGITPDPMLYGVGAGVQLILGPDWNLSVGYQGNFGGGQDSHNFNGGMALSL